MQINEPLPVQQPMVIDNEPGIVADEISIVAQGALIEQEGALFSVGNLAITGNHVIISKPVFAAGTLMIAAIHFEMSPL